MLQPLRSRPDYTETPKAVSDKQSDMFKTITPMQDYDSCPCMQEKAPIEEIQPVQEESAFVPAISDYDEEGMCEPEDGGSIVLVRRQVFAHCMDNEFKKIRKVLSKLEVKDKGIVEAALDRIYKKYRDLEESQEDDGK